MIKRVLTLFLAAVMALVLLPGAAFAAETGESPDAPGAESPSAPAAGVTLVTEQHINYIQGTGNGCFNPGANITRGEAAVMLYRLLAEQVPVTVSYADVPADSWYYDAALELGSLGVIRPEETTFRGGDVITRGEFVSYIAAFFPLRTDAEQFPDVDPDSKYAAAILSARAYGWLVGYPNGNVGPDEPLLRSQAVAMLNRALGRPGDKAVIDANRPALYLDVAPSQWYYYEVMEATVPHEHSGSEVWTTWTEADTKLPANFRTEGAHLIDGWSYYYDASIKDILRGRTKNGFTAGADGRFTTGDSWIDEQLRSIVLKKTNSSMSQAEMLKALYAHVRDDYKYLGWKTFATGDTSFIHDAATRMLSTGRGNCYCYASLFYYLSRWVGYDTRIYSGTAGYSEWPPHCWTEIGGLIYDTQLEWRYVHRDHNNSYYWWFYGIQNGKGGWIYRK